MFSERSLRRMICILLGVWHIYALSWVDLRSGQQQKDSLGFDCARQLTWAEIVYRTKNERLVTLNPMPIPRCVFLKQEASFAPNSR